MNTDLIRRYASGIEKEIQDIKMRLGKIMLSNGLIINGTYQIQNKVKDFSECEMYLGRHLKKQEDVVVRFLYQVSDLNQLDCQRICSLSHNMLFRIYDIIVIYGNAYVVEECKKGITLGEYIRKEGRLPYSKISHIMMQLIDVLSYLHHQTKMVVHANIRPENVVFDEKNGMIYLRNLDVAKALGYTEHQPVLQKNSGFLAPEQYLLTYKHMSVAVDSATDIYCLGCILYYMTTGYMPDVRYDKIVPLRKMEICKEEGLLYIIDKMMNYQPEDRYSDALQLSKNVKECYKLDRRYRQMKWRRFGHIFLASVLFLIGGGILGGGLLKNHYDDIAQYENHLQAVDQYASEQLYYDATDAVKTMEDDYPERIELLHREVEYMFLAGDFEDCVNRARIIERDVIRKIENPEELEDEELHFLGDFYHVYAQACYSLEEYEDAQGLIETALEYYSQDYAYFRDYCFILIGQEKTEKAEGQLKISEELEWDSLEFIFVEACLADAKGETDVAKDKYMKIINESKDEKMLQDSYFNCAKIYDGEKDYRNEILILEQGKSIFSEEERYDIEIARSYLMWGDEGAYSSEEYYNKSRQIYEQLAVKHPDDFEIRGNVAVLYGKAGDEKTEEEQLLVLKDIFREQYQIYMWLSEIEDHKQSEKKKKERNYEQMKRYYDKARKLYQSSIKDYHMDDLEERMTELREKGWF